MFKNKFANNDYLTSSLPSTRRAQFKDVLGTEIPTYFKMGLILLLFSLPFLAALVVGNYYIQYLQARLLDAGASVEIIAEKVRIAGVLISLIKICGLMIFFIGLSGVSRINREITFGNGYIFRKDFILGIKQNVKTYVVISLIMGVLLFITSSTSNNLLTNYGGMVAYVLSGIMYGIIFLVLVPVNMMVLSSDTVYELNYVHAFINCFKFTIRSILICALFALLPIALYFIQSINYIYIQASIYIVLVIFVLPLYSEAWHLFSFSIFDIYLNKKHYPEIYRKGLLIEEKEEDQSHE